jgi:hypothetical protein
MPHLLPNLSSIQVINGPTRRPVIEPAAFKRPILARPGKPRSSFQASRAWRPEISVPSYPLRTSPTKRMLKKLQKTRAKEEDEMKEAQEGRMVRLGF